MQVRTHTITIVLLTLLLLVGLRSPAEGQAQTNVSSGGLSIGDAGEGQIHLYRGDTRRAGSVMETWTVHGGVWKATKAVVTHCPAKDLWHGLTWVARHL